MTSVAPACPVHVDFDPFGPDFQADPAGSLLQARREQPVFYSPDLDYYVVTRYEDISAVFKDDDSFSPRNIGDPVVPLCAAAQAKLDEHDFETPHTIGHDEEPLHMRRRRRIQEPFLASNTANWEPRVREVFTDYIDRFVARGEADLVADLFWEAPAIIALEFMGMAEEEVAQAKDFAQGIMEWVFGKPTEEEQIASCDLMGRHMKHSRGVIERMLGDPSGPGALQHAVRVHLEDPDLIDADFLVGMAMEDLAAAHQTTSYGSTNAFHLLLTHPQSWDAICEDPSLIPGAVEECLRAGAPLQAWRRVAVNDVVVGGVAIPEGGKILLVMGSGNRDEDEFEQPEIFDIRRSNARRHLTFGTGAHSCLGAPLARLEIRIFLEELTRRLPHMRLSEQEIEIIPTISARAPRALHVEWDAHENPVEEDRPGV